MEPVRVLHIIDGMGSGGAEAFIMNLYRNLDRSKVQFDFLLRREESIYREEIEAYGGRIFLTPSFPAHAVANYLETRKFFENHPDYAVVHVHANALIYMTALRLAQKAGIPCRIMHSHNTRARKLLYRGVHAFHQKFIGAWATDYLACSHAAGKWMFAHEEYQVVNNAINIADFLYSEEHRSKIREELHLEGKLVVGHVGRFLESKNHAFILEVFQELYEQNQQAVLLLLGSGPLEAGVRKQVRERGLGEAVIFAGVRKDVCQVLQAMDLFLFPSLYEGLPVTLVEAQAAGLICFVSDQITQEVCLTDLVKVKSLQASAAEWAQELQASASYTRQDMREAITSAGYNMQAVARELQAFYVSQALAAKAVLEG